MTKISRKEVIAELKTFPINRLDSKEMKALDKAISDVEKLEKIEKIFKNYDIKCEEDIFQVDSINVRCDEILSEFLQILRGKRND